MQELPWLYNCFLAYRTIYKTFYRVLNKTHLGLIMILALYMPKIDYKLNVILKPWTQSISEIHELPSKNHD